MSLFPLHWYLCSIINIQEFYTNTWSRILLEKLTLTQLVKKSPAFVIKVTEHHAMKAYWGSGGIAPLILAFVMEPEISLSCPQETATGTYPEADESGPHTILTLSSHLRPELPSLLPECFMHF
jgi:hypothetical protein